MPSAAAGPANRAPADRSGLAAPLSFAGCPRLVLVDRAHVAEQAVELPPKGIGTRKAAEHADGAAAMNEKECGRPANGTVDADPGEIGGNLVGDIHPAKGRFPALRRAVVILPDALLEADAGRTPT